MKYYWISIGGTGAKCLEAFVHMNAAGLMKNRGEIKIIYVDPDASNGNLAKTKNTGLNLKPETLTQPAASGKHIAKVFETP